MPYICCMYVHTYVYIFFLCILYKCAKSSSVLSKASISFQLINCGKVNILSVFLYLGSLAEAEYKLRSRTAVFLSWLPFVSVVIPESGSRETFSDGLLHQTWESAALGTHPEVSRLRLSARSWDVKVSPGPTQLRFPLLIPFIEHWAAR
jgi:hypothetical protein